MQQLEGVVQVRKLLNCCVRGVCATLPAVLICTDCHICRRSQDSAGHDLYMHQLWQLGI